MKYFYDCEFIEDGKTIDLISLGMVREDGLEFYAVSTEFDASKAGQWVHQNVISKLPSPASEYWLTRASIRLKLEQFLGADPDIELWAWVGAYDHVAICQLWGSMSDLPSYMPRFTRELKQLWIQAGCPFLPGASDAHDALGDARDNARKYRIIAEHCMIQEL